MHGTGTKIIIHVMTNWDTTLQQRTTRATTTWLLKAPSTTKTLQYYYNVIPRKVRQLNLKLVNEIRKGKLENKYHWIKIEELL